MFFERFVTGDKSSAAYIALEKMMNNVSVGVSYADMMRKRISGALSNECHDVYYIARENDIAIARHWNGWGKHHDAIGNWGNFFVDEAYRGKGIGGRLLSLWWEDFKSEGEKPLCFLCSAATRELVSLYSRFGFRVALEGTEYGPIYMPVGDNPPSFREFYNTYYKGADRLTHAPATAEHRHEIDCLLRFALADLKIPFGIGNITSMESALLYYPERVGILLSEDNHAVGWSFDGEIQVYPAYSGEIIQEV